MLDAHESRVEPQRLQLAVDLLAAALGILNHMKEATAVTTAPMNGSHKTTRRSSSNPPLPSTVPGGLVALRPSQRIQSEAIDGEREYEVHEVAERLGVAAQTVRKMIDSDRLKAERRGNGRGRWYIPGAELLRYKHQADDQP